MLQFIQVIAIKFFQIPLSEKLDEKFEKMIDGLDAKYAAKDDLNNLKRMTYAIIGALITFLIWTLQEYLRMGL